MKKSPATMTPDEVAVRDRLERTVEEGVSASQAVLEAGKALHELRTRELYRNTHRTWEKYVEDRFRMTRRRADQMVAYAGLHAAVEETGTRVPDSVGEAVVRPLAGLPIEEQVEAFREAAASPEGVTRASVRKAASKRKGKGKAVPKARRFRVPGASVLVQFNAKSDGSVVAALQAALRQLETELAGREAA